MSSSNVPISVEDMNIPELKALIPRYKQNIPELRLSGKRQDLINQINKHNLLNLEVTTSKSVEELRIMINDIRPELKQEFFGLLDNSLVECNLGGIFGSKHLSKSEALLLSNILRYNRSIETLSLRSNYLDDYYVANIIAQLIHHPNIKELHLGYNSIGNKSSLVLVEILDKNKISNLQLEYSKMTSNAGINILNAVADNKALLTLNLTGAIFRFDRPDIIADMITKNQTLLVLDLSDNQMGDEAGEIIASSIPYNNTLLKLNLLQNELGQRSRVAFGKNLEFNMSLFEFNGVTSPQIKKYIERNGHNIQRRYKLLFDIILDTL
ncbi:MAG: hypothetical protein MUO21_01660 [Nitrososphaeraceae archaeon]|nr:hypothetical protein [Nitrososphaeraceae archaeon]